MNCLLNDTSDVRTLNNWTFVSLFHLITVIFRLVSAPIEVKHNQFFKGILFGVWRKSSRKSCCWLYNDGNEIGQFRLWLESWQSPVVKSPPFVKISLNWRRRKLLFLMIIEEYFTTLIEPLRHCNCTTMYI